MQELHLQRCIQCQQNHQQCELAHQRQQPHRQLTEPSASRDSQEMLGLDLLPRLPLQAVSPFRVLKYTPLTSMHAA